MIIRFKHLGTRLMAWGLAGTAIPLGLGTGIALWQGATAERIGTAESLRLSDEDQRHVLEGVLAMVASQQELLEQKVICDLNVARDVLASLGGMLLTESNVTWQAKNQFTSGELSVQLPAVVLGTRPLNPTRDIKIVSPVAEISYQVTKSLEEIIHRTRQVDELAGEVAAASQEQSHGISQLNTAVSHMSSITQSNAATAQESASAAEELNAQAGQLTNAVAELLKLVKGDASPSVSAAASAESSVHPRGSANGHCSTSRSNPLGEASVRRHSGRVFAETSNSGAARRISHAG